VGKLVRNRVSKKRVGVPKVGGWGVVWGFAGRRAPSEKKAGKGSHASTMTGGELGALEKNGEG